MKFPLIEFKTAEGIKYRIFFRKITKKDLKGLKAKDADGLCFNSAAKQPKIIIDPRLKNKRKLSVLIEEYYHAENYEHTEKKARHFARVLTELIILLGWEPTEEEKKKK